MKHYYVAIMAGGIGSRFWPKSRISEPKQFLDILGTGKSLLQMTYDRFKGICPPENIYIVTHENYADKVKEQLPGVSDECILKEPMRRNTAPCVAYVSKKIYAKDPKASIVVAPSDHLITDTAGFAAIINNAFDFVEENDALVTLGIVPSRPDTGYGYIQFVDGDKAAKVFKVKTFTEKPTLEIAKQFLKSGDFLWNSGMFVWKAKTIIKAFQEYLPDLYEAFAGGDKYYNTEGEARFIATAYSQCVNISIDYGIMEKASNVFVIPSEFGWSDLGTWESLYQHYHRDYLGNAVSGKNVMILDATNSMIMAPDNKLVVLQGLDGYCVIDTGDVLLVCQREREQEIKQITADVKKLKGDRYL